MTEPRETEARDRLGQLSREERARLYEKLRRKKEAGSPPTPPLARVERREAPLSFAQLRLWFLDRLTPGSPLYNMPGALRLTGDLDPAVLAACLSEIVRRHEALRTRFEIRGDEPAQIIEPPAPLPLPVIDLSALDPDRRADEERRIALAEATASFDLTRAPLVRALLARTSQREHLLVFVFHHIASDAWSTGVAVRELTALYPALSQGRPSPLPELPLQYSDYAVEQRHRLRGTALDREIGFWRDRLAGATAPELPADRLRPAVPSLRADSLLAVVPQALDAGLRGRMRAERASLSMALLAPFCAFFARLTGSSDIVVGTTVTGRDRRDFQGLIGFFINNLALRTNLEGDPDGGELLARVRRTVLTAFDHQEIPFEKLAEELGLPRDPYRPPLLRVLFQVLPAELTAFQQIGPALMLASQDLASVTAKFDLVVSFSEEKDRLLARWVFDADLFDVSTIARWTEAFETLLAGWLEDPARRISDLPLLTPAQRHQLLIEWTEGNEGGEATADRGRRPLPRLFEEVADRWPDAPAVSLGGESLTYRDLDERAERLAGWLHAAGIGPGDRVALCLDRSFELIAAMLGALKAGAAYVPLDPTHPRERLVFTLEDSGAALVLTSESLAAALDGTTRVVRLEQIFQETARGSGGRLGLDLDPELPAYVIYTSGSTGRPKGVVVTHGSVSRLFAATARWFGFGQDDVWTLFHSPAFDFSVWEIWGALLHGGRLVVVPYWESRSPEAFYRLLREERVTVLNQTPSAFRQLLWAEEAVLGEADPDLALRWVVFGGEALEPSLLAPWFRRHGDERPRLINMYGITETTVHVTFRPVVEEDIFRSGSRVGRPIPDLTVQVLDGSLWPQPIGVPGEICVGGEGLAQGYLGRPELTAERFVPHPSGPPGARLYRSGDLARRLPDGDLEYLGRIDQQVKIRGFRIEPGEIEAALAAHPSVREAVVAVRADAGHERRLAAYVTAVTPPSVSELRDFLAHRLPDAMIPAAFVVLDRLPLTANGKIDRRALPAPEAAAAVAEDRGRTPPRDALERSLAAMVREVLGLPAEREIGVHESFFELGGSSITGAILINRLQETLGEIVHVVVIFDHPTVEALAAYCRDQHPAAVVRVWGVEVPAGDAAELPAGPAEMAVMRRLIVEARPERDLSLKEEPLNPPAVFVLAPPRSGTTLLRVMLGAHPRLFAPPELELLSFQTLAGRNAAFQERDSFWLEGVIRAVMEARPCNASTAERLVAAGERAGWTTRRFYRELQGWIGNRLLVDKTPSYALDPEVLRRAEEWFAGARYIHLLRHPLAARRSFEEARLDQIFFRQPHSFTRRQLAELIWTVSHRNILDFLAGVPDERRTVVRFEDLVRDPARVLAELCGFLGLEYHSEMADPYREGVARMADGVHAVSRMLGDVKFHSHGRVDAGAAERWREAAGTPLGAPARELAATLGYEEVAPAIRRLGRTEAPLTFAQERLWFLDQLTPGVATYNIPSPMRLLGPLDLPALARCFDEIRRRHETLRTRFAATDGIAVQVIDPPSPQPLPCVDLTGLPEPRRRGEAERLTGEEASWPFDLERGPLLRIVLLRLGPLEHTLLNTVHHIVSDGWSVRVLSRELTILYEAFVAGRPSPLPELSVQYADFAVWQRERLSEGEMDRQVAYWRERLLPLPEPLGLPLDRLRPGVQTFRGATVHSVLPRGATDRLRRQSTAARGSLFMALVAGFAALLHRWSGQEDVSVGTPVAGRVRPEVEELIGFFLNTLVLRADLSGSPSFTGLLHQVREVAVGAYAHQDVPFEKLLEELRPERDLSRTPLFQVFFNLANFPDLEARLPGGLTVEAQPGLELEAKFDLTAYASEVEDGVSFLVVYNADLFDAGRIEELLRQYRLLLERAALEPDAPVDAIPLVTPEAAALLPDPTVPLGAEWHGAVHALFAERARLHPERPAVTDTEGVWSYGELAEAAARLAAHLRAGGLAPGDRVGIWAHRSAPLVWGVMGTLWAGGAFVILDPAYPPARLAEMIRLASPRWWLEVDAAGSPAAEVEEALRDLTAEGVLLGRTVLPGGGPHGARELLAGLPAPAAPAGLGPDDLAYVAFTSGSTGAPKGILGRHGPLSHFLPFQRERFGLAETDRYSLLSGLSHDPLQRDIFTPLCTGASLSVPAPEEIVTPGRLAVWMAREGITVAHLTPAMAQLLTESGEGLGQEIPTLRWVLLVGDVLTRLDVDRLRRIAPRVVCVNLYGSTETQRAVGHHVIEEREIADRRAPQVLPLGRGMRDVQLLVVRGIEPPRLAGIGEVGEIWVRSPHLARGYLGDEALTAEKFRVSPFTGRAGDRIYRTGDLGRYRPDGEVTFAGRADQQVKIRGFRIEPAEIEAALGRMRGVREAVVLARQGPQPGDRSLVAYVVGEGGAPPATAELREALSRSLPAYMVPAAFVSLERLPVTPNGKVDRRALAKIAPEPVGPESEHVAPRSDLERNIAAVWSEVLGRERVGVRDNFFDLGGHSLLATRVLSRLRDRLGIELPVVALFEEPTVAGLAARVERAGPSGGSGARPSRRARSTGAEPQVFPLTFAQRGLWLADRREPGNPAHTISAALRLTGSLDRRSLRAALGEIVRRHEALRIVFAERDGEPVQILLAVPSDIPLPLIDLAGLPAPRREAELRRRMEEEARRPFDLAAGPLLRATLIRLEPEEHAAVFALHHIVGDGWSMGVLAREVGALYAAFSQGRPSPLPALPLQYPDVAVWQREHLGGGELEQQVAWWRERLTGAPVLELPTDHRRAPVQRFRGDALFPVIAEPDAARFRDLCRSQGATLFMGLFSVFAALLSRWSGQDDLVVGTAIANRRHSELEGLIGLFANTLALRCDLAGDPPFRTFLERVRGATLEAYERQDVPFERLVAELGGHRDTGRPPLFQVLLQVQNAPAGELDLPGLSISPLTVPARTAKLDVAVTAVEAADGVGMAWRYDLDLFETPTAVRLVRHFEVLLGAAAADPGIRLSELPLLTPAERHQLLAEWSGEAPAAAPPPLSVEKLVAEQAARTPEAVALIHPGGEMTYREVMDRAHRLARFLRSAGVGPEVRVALALDRSPELILALLATLEAGGAFVPIDPDYPAERIALMLEDSGAPLVLTRERLRDGLPEGVARIVTMEAAEEQAAGLPSSPLPEKADPDQAAYVIYTSGSTGRPKGVVATRAGFAGFVRTYDELTGIGPDDRAFLFLSPSFDASASTIYPVLTSGGTLVLHPDPASLSPAEILAFCADHGITLLDFPAGYWRLLVQEIAVGAVPRMPPERHWLTGGEALSPESVRQWGNVVREGSLLLSGYGPTEATIGTTMLSLSTREARAFRGDGFLLGRPFAEMEHLVLDAASQPVPIGVVGELLLAGPGVTRGYHGRPDLTAAAFLPHPLAGRGGREPGARVYRTGDLARWRPDGSLEFLGRADQQVKVRGVRVELGEIEAVLTRHAAVAEAVVDVWEDARGDRRLVAWIVPAAGGTPRTADLRTFVRERLPEQMVPAEVVLLDRLPLNQSGKVDRRGLPAPDVSLSDEESLATAPQGVLEETLAAVWERLLGRERVGREDDFFGLGGHSLLATRLVSRIREVFGIELPLRHVFEAPTLAELATAIDRARREEGAESAPLVPRPRQAGEPVPLSFAQERLWFIDQLQPGLATYNIPTAVRLTGPLDDSALERAFAEVVARHEPLRTRFPALGGTPVQVIATPGPFLLPRIDLASLPDNACGGELARLIAAEAARPFDLSRGPAWRAGLARLGPREHVLMLTLHHIVADGWSMGLLVQELGIAYAALARGARAALPSLPVQYADWAVWQREWLRGAALEAQIAFWRESLGRDVPGLDLPLDRPRPAGDVVRGALRTVHVPEPVARALASLGREEEATLFMLVLAGFATLLHRLTGQSDLAVGTPVAGRTRGEVEGLIGLFLNILALRAGLDGDPPFRELARRLRAVALDAFAHQELPFEKIVEELQPERRLGRTPFFQAMFILQNTPAGELDAGDLVLAPVASHTGAAHYDLTLSLAPGPAGLGGWLEYKPDLLDATTAERWAGGLVRILADAAAFPDLRLSELSLLAPAESHQILTEWNDTAAAFPQRDACLHELFAEQAARRPDAVAVAGVGESLTYRALERRAGALARRMLRQGVRPGDRVAIRMQPSAERVAVVLAVLAVGAAYVPLDPASPRERLEHMLRDAGAVLVMTDEPWEAEEAAEGFAGLPSAAPSDLAYIVYTSGSTGAPKGVVIEHRQAVNTILDINRRFGVGESDRVFAVSALSFDLSVWDLFGTLAAGGTVVLPGPAEHPDPASWSRRMAEEGVTVWDSAPPLLDMLVASGAPLPPTLRLALLSGDWIPLSLPGRVRQQAPECRVVSLGGATEGSIWSILYPIGAVDPAWRSVPYGRPMASQGFHILDRHGSPVPIGVAGELHIAGAGVAVGYLGRPELTAERFVPAPSGAPGERLYRTGDLGRYRADGVIEFLGRLDTQVKIRGFRVELGEIEAVLALHPGVREAVVLARQDGPAPAAGGDRRLVAYVVPEPEAVPSASDLRVWLAGRLPEHMVPPHVVFLDAWPVTPNGKLDRRALPAPEDLREEGEAGFAAPLGEIEETLAAVWTRLLGVSRIGREDDFFALGGHSLLATQLVSRIREVFGPEVPLRRVFEAPALADLAAVIDAARREGTAASPPRRQPRTPGEPLPLSFAQERLWFIDQLQPGQVTYSMPFAVRLTGPLDPVALERAFDEIVARHEPLRTRFPDLGGAPVQMIEPPGAFRLLRVDLSALPEAARAGELERLAGAEASRPFDLAHGPLLRAGLLRLDERQHVLVLNMHHIVSDGWSMGVLVRELGAAYAALARGERPLLPELPVAYADWAVWQREQLRGESLETQLAFWREQLGGEVPPLDLPLDRPRPAGDVARGARRAVLLPAAEAAALEDLARAEEATPFMLLLAGFLALLRRLTGQADLTVGTPVAGRTRGEVEGLIGLFLNTLALRADLGGDPPFRELIHRLRRVSLDAFTHQDLPFEKIVEELQPERHLGRTPFFQAMLVLQNTPMEELDAGDLVLTMVPATNESVRFDLTLSLTRTPAGLAGRLEYKPDLLDSTTVERWVDGLVRMLGAAVAAPDLRLSELPLLSAAERHQLVIEPETGGMSIRQSLTSLFEEQVDRTPEATAVSLGTERLTYRQLDQAANRLAHHLLSRGAGPGQRIALLLDRSPSLVEAILGVLKTGAAYLPLDPVYPRERLAFSLEDSAASLVVTTGELALERDAGGEGFILLDRDAAEIARRPGTRPGLPVNPEQPAYVIYTSGSTGRPKGVVIPHGNVSRLLTATQPWFGFGPDDVWTLFHSYAFDFSVWEIWGALLYGGRLVVVPYWESRSPESFHEMIGNEGVTVLNQTPSAFRQLVWAEEALSAQRRESLALRWVIFGGEALDPSLLAPWFERHGDERPRLINMYGITETTVHVTFRPLTRADLRGTSRIGRPIPDLSLHVLDRWLGPQPLGVPGEICVGGAGLAHGYLGRPELTAERFVPDPFGAPGARLYRSGDLARRLPNGDLEYLGRIDQQVKIRGFRVELGEIEGVLAAHPEVREAVVLLREQALVAYVILEPGGVPSADTLRGWLAARLPDYMVPPHLMFLDALPVTPNGKLDRRALPAPEATPRERVAPRDSVEERLAAIWSRLLGVSEPGVHDHFFELGGHSLLATRLVAAVRDELGVELPVREVFERPTIAGQALAVAERRVEHVAEDELARLLEGVQGLSDEEIERLLAAEAGERD